MNREAHLNYFLSAAARNFEMVVVGVIVSGSIKQWIIAGCLLATARS